MFDNVESRSIVASTCEQNGIPCLHAGLAAMGYFEVKWNEVYNLPAAHKGDIDGIPCEYPMAANLVIMCVATMSEVINRYVDSDEKINVEMWLKSMSFEVV